VSEEAKKNQEEEAIEKTYDWTVTKRLLGYLKPYWTLAAVALVLTFLTNILISLQPWFTKQAVDDFITPKQTDGIWFFAFPFFACFFFALFFHTFRKFCSTSSDSV
jgi:ABC-type multidrug transport system fused ATPase/permease subunit